MCVCIYIYKHINSVWSPWLREHNQEGTSTGESVVRGSAHGIVEVLMPREDCKVKKDHVLGSPDVLTHTLQT